MTETRSILARTRRMAPLVSLLSLCAALAGPAAAAEPRLAAYGASGQDELDARGAGGRRLDLSIGRSVVIDLPRDAKEVFVANPAVANAVVRSTRKIFLIGVANGATSVFVMDAEGRQIASLEVNVGRDLNVLRQTLRTAIPTGRIDIKPAGDSILLTGQVASSGDAQQAVDIARAFVGQSGGAAGAAGVAGGTTTGAVINALTINGRDQVMLKVTVVEMARSALKQLGVSVSGNWNTTDIALAAIQAGLAGVSGTAGSGGIDVTGGYRGTNGTIGGTLQALERAGVSRVLAEPTLVAISGESATFLAGGEVPIVVTSACPTGQFCPPSVTYKTYGVALGFTPVVLSEGRISLKVSTEVNEIDRETQIAGNVGFRTRKTSTVVELPSGASMMTAGLISSQSANSLNGVPGLINLPVLGALFRSRDFQRRDSELMIMVTPYIAKPMETAQVARPDDNFVDASDPQTVLFGRLNKLYGVAGPATARGYSGRYGFITD